MELLKNQAEGEFARTYFSIHIFKICLGEMLGSAAIKKITTRPVCPKFNFKFAFNLKENKPWETRIKCFPVKISLHVKLQIRLSLFIISVLSLKRPIHQPIRSSRLMLTDRTTNLNFKLKSKLQFLERFLLTQSAVTFDIPTSKLQATMEHSP